ncbi:MAG: 50S ribosomal protein L25/general stress protein Ctc [Alphaproteobacteria bacterium]|nr:50S ribosomal protein L25/general stress protein Ctc [Alphaproteobacteria bacterium]
MTDVTTISAATRAKVGTGGARAVRREGMVPAVVYGGKGEPEYVSIALRDFEKHYQTGRMLSTLFVLDIGGKKTRVIPREVQVDPVSDRPIHADFQRLVEGARIRLFIPVHFKNHGDSPGLKRGGVLNVVRHEVEFFCPSDHIPQFIEGDLGGMDIGDSMHISHFKLPQGLEPVIRNRDFTIATVAAPSSFAEVETAPTAAAEGEAAAATAEGAAAAAPAAGAPAAAGAAAPAAGGKAPAAAAPAAKAPAAKK